MNEDVKLIAEIRIAAKKMRTWGTSEIRNKDLIKSMNTLADITEDREKWWNKAKELEKELSALKALISEPKHYQRVKYYKDKR